MVVIRNCENMFWGITIDAGKRYSQVVKQGFHVSMAALDAQAKKPSENVQVLLQHEATEYLLCTLNGSLLQQSLDLNFETGEQVSFCLNGSGVVHLTGFLIPEEEEEPDFDESFSGSEDEEAPSLIDTSVDSPDKAGKRKAIAPSKATKKMKLSTSIEDDDDDSDDIDSEEEEGFSDDFDDEFDDEDSEEEATPEKKVKTKPQAKITKVETPVSQKNKQDGKVPKQDGKTATPKTPASETVSNDDSDGKKQGGKIYTNVDKPVDQVKKELESLQPGKQQATAPSASGTEESAKKKKKKKKKKSKEGDASQNDSTASTPATTPKPESTPKKRVVAGGTVVEDLKVGHGPEAKPGKMASVYYIGTLQKTSKRFDSCTEGKPFRFRLNQGEVIKGWDNGVLGMKVGGKRRITVPANQGYGNVKQGPIPPNSTLVFEVELKAVS